MQPPDLPPDESARLVALRATGLLDTPAEERFDRITRTTARLFDVPIALVSLVDECRQWFKSRVGLDATETPRDISFCGHAILSDEVFVVEDAASDARFADNPLVTGPPHIRFYAGCPLKGPNGECLGTLCLIAPEPRSFDDEQIAALRDMAGWASHEVNRRVTESALATAREGERFFESSLDLMHLASPKGRYLKVNPAYCHALGWSEAELLATPIQDFIHFDDHDISREGTRRLLRGETLQAFTHRLRHKDGTYRWINWSGFLEGDRIFGFGRDVTALRATEEALKASEARYRFLVEESTDFASEVDASGRFLCVSEPLEREMGYGHGDLDGRFCTDFVAPEDRPGLARFFKHLLSGVEGESFLFRALHRDGRFLWHESKGRRVKGPLGGAVITTSRNVDDRIKAQEALASSEIRYHALVENMAEGLLLRGADGQVLACNPAAERLLGVPLEQLLGRGFDEPFPNYIQEDGRPLAPQDMPGLRALREGRPVKDVVIGTRKPDGTAIWHLASAIPLQHPEGNQVLVTFNDITALREIEAEHRLMLEMTTDIIAVHDPKGRFRFVTPSIEAITGFTPEEMLGHLAMEFAHPKDRPQLIDLHTQLLRGERPGVLRYRIAAKDGQEVWMESSGKAVRDPNGRVREVVYTSRDVTREQLASQGQARLMEIFDRSPDFVAMVRVDGQPFYANPALRAFRGVAPGDNLESRHIRNAYTPGSFVRIQLEAIPTAIEQGVWEGETRLVGAGGQELPVSQVILAHRNADGSVAYLSSVARDLRARQEMEDALRLGEARFRAMLSAIPDEMFRVRRDGTYLDVHASRPGALWHPPEYFIGRTLHQILPEGVADARLAAIHRALATREIQIIEYRLEKDGRATDFEARTTPSGEDEAITIVRDVTREKALERAKAEFIATVSHELRTPLTSIRGSLGLLNDGSLGELPGPVKELASIAEQNALRLIRLVNDILDDAKRQNAKLDIRPGVVPLEPLLRRILASMEGFGSPLGVGYDLDEGPIEALAWVDADRLVQVLVNLLSNASRYAPQGSLVTLRWRPCDLGQRVEVEDRGRGIPIEFKGRIFEKFAQASGPGDPTLGGTGLGLHISKSLMEAMGGTIGFESEPGRTVFWVEIPAAPKEGAEGVLEAPGEATPPPKLSGSREALGGLPVVLHVEDDPGVHRILSVVLQDRVRLVHAGTLHVARQLLSGWRPDLVILDNRLPDGEGPSLLPEIAALPGAPVPVLVFSGDELDLKGAGPLTQVLLKSETDNRTLQQAIAGLLRRG